jgi:hypothetical protein
MHFVWQNYPTDRAKKQLSVILEFMPLFLMLARSFLFLQINNGDNAKLIVHTAHK